MTVAISMASLLNNNQVNAFCLWNCEAQEVAEKGPDVLDYLRLQFTNGMYQRTIYCSDDVVDGKAPSKAEPGKMITADELKKEWKEHPELYEGDCHKTWDLTPQLLAKFDEEATK